LQASMIQSVLAARRIGGREEFHRRLFDTMLGGPWWSEVQPPASAEAPVLLGVLSRWITEAPAGDELGVVRMLAVRGRLRTLVLATGTSFDSFLSGVLGLDAAQLQAPGRLPGWKQAKLAALCDASLVCAEALASWAAVNPVWARLAAIVALDACPKQAGAAEATAAIGRWLASVEPIDMPQLFLEQLKFSAFHVSYLADGGRHAFKRAIVRQAAHMVRKVAHAPSQPAAATQDGRPRVTIVGELLFPQHAMFRCYAQALAGLKEHFHVTLLADAPTRCAEHQQISDAQLYFPPGERDIGRLARLVASTAPDIVLYPSIGMTFWTFALSLLRLAPLQLMSVGHPAPSCSDEIDGALIYREMASSPLPGFGPVFTYDRQPLPVPPPGGWTAALQTAGGALVVSVNAASMKLSPDFLATVHELMEHAPSGTRLQFFPNVAGPEYLSLRSELQQMFPQAQVHRPTGYAAYMAELSASDLVLQSFPFGGTNTVMDALALGIPMVCMEGEDLAGAADPLLLRHAGLSALCAGNRAEYLAVARRLLAEPQERARVRELGQAALGRLEALQAPGERSMADAVSQAWAGRAAR
jgi:hypothetical protein